MSEDERVRARMAALEAEVRADATLRAEAKARALERMRADKAEREAERAAAAERAAPKGARPALPASTDDNDGADRSGLGDAVALAQRAAGAKAELARPVGEGGKKWTTSAALSLFFGPVGWMYAGAWREAIPAGLGYLALAAVLSKLPFFLVMPVMMVAMPVSAIVGVLYAVKFNRTGKRQRIFGGAGGKDAPAKLPAAKPAPRRR